MSETCPVCVFTAANVDQASLAGIKCFNCGDDLAGHPFEVSESVAPSGAFAVNQDAIHTEHIGSEWWKS